MSWLDWKKRISRHPKRSHWNYDTFTDITSGQCGESSLTPDTKTDTGMERGSVRQPLWLLDHLFYPLSYSYPTCAPLLTSSVRIFLILIVYLFAHRCAQNAECWVQNNLHHSTLSFWCHFIPINNASVWDSRSLTAIHCSSLSTISHPGPARLLRCACLFHTVHSVDFLTVKSHIRSPAELCLF